MKLAAPLARNATGAATSSGSPIRLIGCLPAEELHGALVEDRGDVHDRTAAVRRNRRSLFRCPIGRQVG